ncbi:MAG: hypothetical protein ACTHN5_23945 [Phycisphaerae bacterium]
MTRDEVFDSWAPRESVWTDWVKPVLFAQMPAAWDKESGGVTVPAEGYALDAIAADGRTAVILDLPGETAVGTALQLARRGFRPVPLFNGAADGEYSPLSGGTSGQGATIDMWSVMRALWFGAATLQALPVPPDAAPVFVLDSRRRLGERSPMPGVFDNRWIAFATDFPSARVMREHNMAQTVVVCWKRTMPDADLSQALAGWQEAGIPIFALQVEVDAEPRPITVQKPGRFEGWWYELTAAIGLRRRMLGGFGGTVPMPSSGG